MSLATWKAEFYPVKAVDVAAEDAAAHSLRKWEGLRPEALARHGVFTRENDGDAWVSVGDGEEALPISGSSCALCEAFCNEDPNGEDSACRECPLFIARGGISCDEERHDEDASPWHMWQQQESRDPEPMIRWLKVTVEGSAA